MSYLNCLLKEELCLCNTYSYMETMPYEITTQQPFTEDLLSLPLSTHYPLIPPFPSLSSRTPYQQN